MFFWQVQAPVSHQPTQLAIDGNISFFSKPDTPCANNLPSKKQSEYIDETQNIDYDNPIPSTSKQVVTAKDLIPVPKQSTEAKIRQRSRKQHATIITGTLLKEALLEKEKRKISKMNKNVAETKTKKTGTKSKKTETKKSVTETKTVAKSKKKTKTDMTIFEKKKI